MGANKRPQGRGTKDTVCANVAVAIGASAASSEVPGDVGRERRTRSSCFRSRKPVLFRQGCETCTSSAGAQALRGAQDERANASERTATRNRPHGAAKADESTRRPEVASVQGAKFATTLGSSIQPARGMPSTESLRPLQDRKGVVTETLWRAKQGKLPTANHEWPSGDHAGRGLAATAQLGGSARSKNKCMFCWRHRGWTQA